MILLAAFFALVASFGLAWLYALALYWADRHEKEPKLLLLGMFLWGAVIAVLGSIVFSLALDAGVALVVRTEAVRDMISTVVIAPLVEESMKGAALILLFLFARNQVDSLFDGVIYAALVGLGFEAVENFLYLLGALGEGGLGSYLLTMFLRLGLFGFTHAFYTSLTGLGLAAFRLYSRRWWAWAAVPLGWLAAVLTHAFHNATVSTGSALCLLAVLADWAGLIILVGILVWALRREHKWLRQYLADEVRAGHISPAQYETACSLRKRAAAQRKARRTRRSGATRRFYQTLTKLAFLRAHIARGHTSPPYQRRLRQLREEIARLAPEAETA